MKKGLICIAFFYIFQCTLLGQVQEKFVNVKKENLRDVPNGNKVTELTAGTAVKIMEVQGKWTKVQLSGWIWTESLTDDKTRVYGYTIQVSHILCLEEATARNLLAKLEAGADFAVVAKENSIDATSAARGGDLGRFARGDLFPEFEDPAFRLEINELSPIIKTHLGYHIIKRLK